jgi:hypothetical protein
MSRLRGTLSPAAVLALALVTGCGTLATGSNDDASDTAAVSAEVTTTPETEDAEKPGKEGSDTGAGTSTQAQNNQVAVRVPQLPIGGDEDDQGDDEQCVSVSYLGADRNPIPTGVSISITGASFAPPLLELGGSACSSGETPCLAAGFAFTAGNTGSESGTCFVAVRATGARPAGDDDDDFTSPIRDVTLSLGGLVDCPDGEEALCADFAGRVEKDDQTIGLEVRIVGTTTETTTEEATEETTESTSTSESTEETSTSEDAGTPPD